MTRGAATAEEDWWFAPHVGPVRRITVTTDGDRTEREERVLLQFRIPVR